MTEIPEHLLKRAQAARDKSAPVRPPKEPRRVIGRRLVEVAPEKFLTREIPPLPHTNDRNEDEMERFLSKREKNKPERSFFNYLFFKSNGKLTDFGEFMIILAGLFTWLLGCAVIMMVTDPNFFTISLVIVWAIGHPIGIAVWQQHRKYNKRYKR